MRKRFLWLVCSAALAAGLCRPALVASAQDTAPAPPVEATPASPAVGGSSPASAPASAAAAMPILTPATQPTAPRLSPALPAPSVAAVVAIEGPIDAYTLMSVKQRGDRAIQGGASVIVIELDTPGGLVTSALDICRYIKGLPVPTVAWVHDQAYSAGTLIASACDEIVMSPASAMGTSAPIIPGMNLAPTERAKALSPLLAEFRDNARANGYDYTLLHAVCELGVEVYEVRHRRTGEVRLVNQGDYEIMVKGADPDGVRAAARHEAARAYQSAPIPTGLPGVPGIPGTPTTPAPQPPVTPIPPSIPGVPGTGSGPLPGGLSYEELGGSMPEEGTEADRGAWELVRQVHDGKSLLTLHQHEALAVGLASSATVRTDADLQSHLRAAQVVRVDLPWANGASYWLTRPWARALLLIIVLVCGYLEFQAPGLSLPGALAVIALALLLISPFLVGIAQLWHLVLFFVGFAMLLVEIFMPTVGLVGAIGAVMMFVGLVVMAVPSGGGGALPLPTGQGWHELQESLGFMLLAVVVSGVAFVLITRHFRRLPFMERLVLRNAAGVPAAAGLGLAGGGEVPLAPGAAGPAVAVSGGEAIGQGRLALGSPGRAVSPLRPTGRAELEGQVVDVVTRGEWIEAGRPIRVVEIHGNRVVVEGGT